MSIRPGKICGCETAVLGLFGRCVCILNEKSPDPVPWRVQSERQTPRYGGINDCSLGAAFSRYRCNLQAQT